MASNTSFANQFSAGVEAYNNGLYNEAEALWMQVTGGNEATQAAYNLAVLYEQGLGQHGSNERIVSLYKTAAERGSVDAQYNYGGLFYAGERVPRRIEDAIYWWSQAANLGHSEAQYNLGVLLFEGQDIKQNLRLATQWLSFSADAGHELASSLLKEAQAALDAHHESLRQGLSKGEWADHETWLFHQDPRDLTIELSRFNEVESALSFIDEAGILEVAHPYLDNGQVVVVAGVFTREQDALNAISQLTADVQRRQPKPVAISEVQRALRSN